MRPLLPMLLVGGCAAPNIDELFNSVEFNVVPDVTDASARFVDAIDSAEDTLHVALPDGDDLAITDALLAAFDRGVQVEIITDVDQRDDPGLAALMEAEVPVTLADGALTYFEFTLNSDVSWSSDETVMSHAFVVADETRITAANAVGDLLTGPRVMIEVRGEDIVQDLLIEHNQILGGTDATSVTAYDSPAKSIADYRFRYGTAKPVDLEMWFGPQERLTKRVIDSVYHARTAVWVLTDELANDGLARALQDKAEWGFDVKVVVGPAFRTTSDRLADELLQKTPDIEKVQVTDVQRLPTVILIDLPPDGEGFSPRAEAMVMTHDLVSSARLYRGETVITDQLIDGAMWVMTDRTVERLELIELRDLFNDLFDRGEVL